MEIFENRLRENDSFKDMWLTSPEIDGPTCKITLLGECAVESLGKKMNCK